MAIPVSERSLAHAAGRPRVLYVSYDGASEPLGRSQVVPYLEGLSRDCQITLISFEKPTDDRAEMQQRLAVAGIEWMPLPYHRRPQVISTAWDILRGAVAVRATIRRRRIQIVHVRSYVAAMVALIGGAKRESKLLFDIRGFWVDERVEGGAWPAGGFLYQVGKRCERWLFRAADALVTLTHASVPQIGRWLSAPPPAVHVIPTCVDLKRYGSSSRAPTRLVWCGSIGTFYRFDLGVSLARVSGLPLLVLTRQRELALAMTEGIPADVRTVRQEQVSEELSGGGIGLCLYTTGFSNLARAPTRFAEYLAAGMVVAVSPGVGDLEDLVKGHQVGVVLASEDPAEVRRTAEDLQRLSEDPLAPARCRSLAQRLFSLEGGVEGYLLAYRQLLDDSPSSAASRSASASHVDGSPASASHVAGASGSGSA